MAKREVFLMAELTKQELCILELVAQGLINKEIAQKLNISTATTKAHLESIYKKLNAHNRVQAVVKAINLQLIDV
mgnify:FL=1